CARGGGALAYPMDVW
nr:immunoglobulin heavy chain junction region [Macaca mulatta]MOV50714.1 immunoglobulin heavy chain junction region [Macaca mulatta]MOV51615.1 immunoglobulin heavy chain junction region [Macaca mulatta]